MNSFTVNLELDHTDYILHRTDVLQVERVFGNLSEDLNIWVGNRSDNAMLAESWELW